LENDFFGSLEDSENHKMNRAGITALGKKSGASSDGDGVYKQGIKGFHLAPKDLIKLFKEKPELKENTIIAVSNSSSDGASALQEHYKLFENEKEATLAPVRRGIYTLSDAIPVFRLTKNLL
jgi:hypothetical protein